MARKIKRKNPGIQKCGRRLFIYCTIYHRIHPLLGDSVDTVIANEF